MTSADPHLIWFDQGWWLFPDGHQRLLTWNAGSKTLYFCALNPFEKDQLLARIETEDEVRRRLAGWEEHNTTKDGLDWLEKQLKGCRPAQ